MEKILDPYHNFYNRLKYSFRFPYLIANKKEHNGYKVKNTTTGFSVTKNTTDAELEKITKEVNDQKIADIVFSEVKRNSKDEIIAITTKFKDERGFSQCKSEYNSMGISPETIVIHEIDDGSKYLEICSSTTDGLYNKGNFSILSSMWGDDNGDMSEFFFEKDFEESMNSMLENMQKQQELFIKMMSDSKEKLLAENPSCKLEDHNKLEACSDKEKECNDKEKECSDKEKECNDKEKECSDKEKECSDK